MQTKTASNALKLKNGIPTNPNAVRHSVSQPGPEDGRDQNISPSSNSYDPAVITTKLAEDHNVEVHRTDEDDSFKSTNQSNLGVNS